MVDWGKNPLVKQDSELQFPVYFLACITYSSWPRICLYTNYTITWCQLGHSYFKFMRMFPSPTFWLSTHDPNHGPEWIVLAMICFKAGCDLWVLTNMYEWNFLFSKLYHQYAWMRLQDYMNMLVHIYCSTPSCENYNTDL